jgi:hypothetical protein
MFLMNNYFPFKMALRDRMDGGAISNWTGLAKQLSEIYGSPHPSGGFIYHGTYYSSTNHLAAHFMEREIGMVIAGISLKGGRDPKIWLVPGLIETDGVFYDFRGGPDGYGRNTHETRFLADYRNPVVSSFALALVQLVETRARGQNRQVADVMIPGALPAAKIMRNKILANKGELHG